jgi:hypothetical protein
MFGIGGTIKGAIRDAGTRGADFTTKIGTLASRVNALASSLDVTPTEAKRLSARVYDDVRAQMKGLKDGETRSITDNVLGAAESEPPTSDSFFGRPETLQPTRTELSSLKAAARDRGYPDPQDVPAPLEQKIAARRHLEILADMVESAKGTVGRYRSENPDGTYNWVGQKSALPKELQQGFSYDDVADIIRSGLAGEKLSPKRARFFDDLQAYALKKDGPISEQELQVFLGEHGLNLDTRTEMETAAERQGISAERGDTSFDPASFESRADVHSFPASSGAEGPPPPKYAGSINLERIKTEADVRQQILNMSKQVDPRETVSLDSVAKAADDMGFDLPSMERLAQQSVENRAQFLAARQLHLSLQEQLASARELYRNAPTPENFDGLRSAETVALRAYRAASSIASESGLQLRTYAMDIAGECA